MEKSLGHVMIRLSEEQHRAFKTYCVEHGVSMQEVVKAFILELLSGHDKTL